jgi:hypothetical protein
MWQPYNEQLQTRITTLTTPSTTQVYTTDDLLPAFKTAPYNRVGVLRTIKMTLMPQQGVTTPLGVQLSYFCSQGTVAIPMTRVKMMNQTQRTILQFRLPRVLSESRTTSAATQVLAVKFVNTAATATPQTVFYTIDVEWDLSLDTVNTIAPA